MTGVSTLGQALAQIERIKDQQSLFTTLSTQLATGRKTQEFSGLGTDVLSSKRLRADLNSLDGYIKNIKNAERRLNLMLNAIEQFQQQAENFEAALTGINQESTHQQGDVVYWDDPTTPDVVENIQVGMSSAEPDEALATLQDLAGNMFNFIFDLLNSQDGDRYLFSGAETLTPPIGSTGTIDAAIATLQTDWKSGTITTTELIADLQDRVTTGGNTNALTDTIIGYNATLSSGNAKDVFVRVNERSEIEYTALANDQGFRDILVALSYIKSSELGPIADEVEIDSATGLPVVITEGAPGATNGEMKDNFFQVFNELVGMVNDGITRIEQDVRFKLEGVRARLGQIEQNHINEQNVLITTVSDIEDADLNEVSVKISQLQVQLEASFRVTAINGELSLVNFLF